MSLLTSLAVALGLAKGDAALANYDEESIRRFEQYVQYKRRNPERFQQLGLDHIGIGDSIDFDELRSARELLSDHCYGASNPKECRRTTRSEKGAYCCWIYDLSRGPSCKPAANYKGKETNLMYCYQNGKLGFAGPAAKSELHQRSAAEEIKRYREGTPRYNEVKEELDKRNHELTLTRPENYKGFNK